ncbi:MAG: pyridoxamine 5'-phosphate oxidase family protein [Actinomycetota bacterium]|jgi:hypothetical protein
MSDRGADETSQTTEVTDYEDVTVYPLDDHDEARLLDTATECTFIWATRDGWPVGVIMNFVWHDGRFWLTATDQRKRITAVRNDDRVSVCVNGTGFKLNGRTVTYAGRCTVHDDRATQEWFYTALSRKLMGDTASARGFEQFLDSPRRVVLEVVPERRIGFDGQKMMGSTAAKLVELGSE